MSIENLSPEHRQIAETNRERIMAFIARTAVPTQIERPMPDIGMDDDTVS